MLQLIGIFNKFNSFLGLKSKFAHPDLTRSPLLEKISISCYNGNYAENTPLLSFSKQVDLILLHKGLGMNILQTITKNLKTLILETFELTPDQITSIQIQLNTDKPAQFGDLNCNAGMVLAKQLGLTPRDIAQKIQNAIPNDKKLSKHIAKTLIAGPGFLNIYLKDETWLHIAQEIFADQKKYFSLDPSVPRKKYLIEFVSANPTGPLHLGHGRGGIIGDVLAKVLNFLGHNADTEFYINDAGLQIVKLGNSLKTRCQQELGDLVEFPEDGYAGAYMIDLARKCIEEHGKNVVENDVRFFADYAKAAMLKLQTETLKNYGITFDRWFSEKNVHKSGAVENAIEQLRKKDLIYEKEGATWFLSTSFGDDKDRVIKKQDGAYTYIASDIAYHKEKFERGLNPPVGGYDVLIDILGQDHHGYVVRLKATMEALGYGLPRTFDVILYQLVSLKQAGEQVKMSKRAGTFEALSDVIEKVGTDVARFFYLNRKADAHLDFDLDIALKKTEENPVYYIQYGFVRTNSLLVKGKENEALKSFVENLEAGKIVDVSLGDAEKELVKKMCSLESILATIATSYQTHLLTYYTLELARSFHAYYATNKIIDPENLETSKSRLFLTKLMQQTLATCLDLLGLQKPKRM